MKPGPIGSCTTNVLVENCQFFKGHGASIGSVPQGCVTNIYFSHISISGQQQGCNLKTLATPTGTGYVKNVTWDNIKISNTGYCIRLNTNYVGDESDYYSLKDQEFSTKDGLGASITVSDIYYSNIVGTNCKYPAVIDCLSGQPCEGISLVNVNVASGATNKNMECEYAHGTASNVQPPSCLLP